MNGFVNYTFGYKCAFRLLVTLHSLRSHSNTPITLFFKKGDRACAQLEPFILSNFDNVEVVWKSIKETPNIREPFKVECLNSSPYEKTFLIDSDLLFCRNPDEMFKYLDSPHYLSVSKFSNWTVNKKQCKKHLVQLRERVYPREKVDNLFVLDKPYFNIGVFGVRKCSESQEYLKRWHDDMISIIENFMCGEMTFNYLQWEHERSLLPEIYNRSFNFGLASLQDTCIIHYHGNGHRKIRNESVRIYWDYVKKMCREKEEYIEWLETDKFLGGLLKEVKDNA